MESYRKIVIHCDNAEEELYSLHALGALGTELIAPGSFAAFLPDDAAVIAAIEDYCRAHGFQFSLSAALANQNWVQKCAEIWQPITVGSLTIHPLLDVQSNNPPDPNTILIIPGEGFGTGHHPSTRLAIAHIQDIRGNPIHSALDFGTGNGILAIATALIFNQCQIEAIDNDAAAITNAREIVALNHLENQINLSVNSIEAIDKRFDLISANIYAEVLCAYENHMFERLNGSGLLVLAGIMRARAPLVREKFIAPRWQLVRETSEDGWNSFLYKKVTD